MMMPAPAPIHPRSTRRKAFLDIALAAVAGVMIPCPVHAAEKSAQPIPVAPLKRDTPVDFETEILPAFRTSCLACHNRTTAKANLILETPQTILKGGESGPVVVPGKSADSLLLELAAHESKPLMPPRDNKASAPNLTPEQLALVKLWIDQGARGEVHSSAIQWQTIARAFTPAYAVAVTPDGRFAAVGRANQLHLYDLASQRMLPPLADPAIPGPAPAAHRDMIYSLAFSPDGTRLASGSFGEVKIWRRAPVQTKFALATPTPSPIAAVAASADGKWLAIAGDGPQVLLVDAATGKPVRTLETPATATAARIIRFSPDGTKLLFASDKALRIWNLADGAATANATAFTEIRAAAWTHAGKRLATGHADNSIRLYTLTDASPAALTPGPELKGHTGPISALDAIAPGNQLLSGSADGTLRVWSLDDAKQLRQLAQGCPVTAAAARPDGKFFASAGDNGVTKLWDATKDAPAAELKGNRALLARAAERAAAQQLAAADTAYYKSVLARAEADLKAQQERQKKAADAKAAAEKPVAEKAAARSKAAEAKAQADKALADKSAEQKTLTDTAAAVAQAQKAAQQAVINAATAPFQAIKLRPELLAKTKAATDASAALAKLSAALKDATDRVTAADRALKDAEAALKAAELARANAVNEFDLAAAAVDRATKSIPVAKATVAAAEEKQKLADAAATAAQQAAAAPPKVVRAVALSPGSATLATAGDDQTIQLWSADAGVPLRTIEAHKGAILSLAFRDDGAVLSGSVDRSALLSDVSVAWSLERTIGTGDASSVLSDRVNALAFAPDGRTLATGSGEPTRGGEVKLWDVAAAGQLLHDFRNAHSDAVLCLDFSHDGTRLASGAADRFVKVHDVAGKRLVLSLEGHTHHVLGVSFKADGRTLASGAADGQVKLWDLTTGERKAGNAVPPAAKETTAVHFVGITDQAVVASADAQFRVINDAGGVVRTFAGPPAAPDHTHAAAVAADAKTFLTAGQSGTLYLWDATAGKLLATFPPPP